MTDHDLEQRLRAWYQAQIDDRECAPFELRADLSSLGAPTAATGRGASGPRWSIASLRFAPLALAAAAVVVILLVGIGLVVRPPDVGPSPGPVNPTAPTASAMASEVVYGWPDTDRNGPGVYSWDRARCGRTSAASCSMGFMHNGYGSGDVEIVVREGATSLDGGMAVTIAGYDGVYRRLDALREDWIVEIEGTTITIQLSAQPGTSEAELAEAHAIIDSMRTEPRDNDLGFRLLFTLTTGDWDSG